MLEASSPPPLRLSLTEGLFSMLSCKQLCVSKGIEESLRERENNFQSWRHIPMATMYAIEPP